MINIIKKLPGVEKIIQSNYYRCLRHRISLRTNRRENSTFTGFLRLPSQFDALVGPVLEHLLASGIAGTIKIADIGCSNGSEAYTIGSALVNIHPEISFHIRGFDINPEMISKASSAKYTHDEIYFNERITGEFIESTFDREADIYHIKNKIVENVSFSLADALSPELKQKAGSNDIVIAQNFLFHLPPKMAAEAFDNICTLLKPVSFLFVDGVDISLREKHTRKNSLVPLEYKIEDIHNEARWARSVGWPYEYWGLEPFLTVKKDWQRRYATIFMKN